MWDNNAPLQLLKTMPNRLNQENLEKIQLLIDADKYKNSIISGFDLCGIFAPFCRGCDKTSIYPCAVSYIRMLQSQGMEIEIDASPSAYEAPTYTTQINVPRTKPVAPAPKQYEQRPVKKTYERKMSEPKPVVAAKPIEKRYEKPYEPKYIEPKIVEPKVVEPKHTEPQITEPKIIEPKVVEKKIVEQKAPIKQAEVIYNEVVEEELAVTQSTPTPVEESLISVPLTEDIVVEEKEIVPENTVTVDEQVVEEPVTYPAYEVSEKYVAEKPAENKPVNENKEGAPRKLRIAVARRKLQ